MATDICFIGFTHLEVLEPSCVMTPLPAVPHDSLGCLRRIVYSMLFPSSLSNTMPACMDVTKMVHVKLVNKHKPVTSYLLLVQNRSVH